MALMQPLSSFIFTTFAGKPLGSRSWLPLNPPPRPCQGQVHNHPGLPMIGQLPVFVCASYMQAQLLLQYLLFQDKFRVTSPSHGFRHTYKQFLLSNW